MSTDSLALRLLRFPFALAVGSFFQSIEVEGADNVPPVGPILVLPNHLNAFVDPLVVQHGMSRPLTVTAKNTLAERPLYGALMRAARVVQFHRQSEWGKGASPRETFAAFEVCRQRLSAGEALCIFPEGISHDDPGMRAFRAGPAQIALDYVARDDDLGGLHIVPVGLVYDAKEHFRSRALVRFGAPIRMRDWALANPRAGRRELTREIEARVRELVVEHARRREGIVMTFGARVALAARREPASLGAEARETRRLRDVMRARTARDPARARALYRRLLRHRTALREAGVDPEDVFVQASWKSSLRFVLGEAVVLGAALPPAAAGAALNAAPAIIVCRITRRLSTLRDLWAPNAVFAGALAFPATWALEGLVAAVLGPPLAGPLVFGGAWLGARFALRYADRWRRSRRRARAMIHAARRTKRWREVVEEARSLASELASPEVHP